MALPVILVSSGSGSDTAASGAGPNNALSGSAGVTSADGLTVVLDGSPDLSGVATDGSHVLFMSDTTAGARNFSKITGTANSGTPTAQVTVANAFQALNTDAWAIGGERASLGSTTSAKLVENNSGNGDAMPGWAMEFQSAHAETLAATLTLRRAGNATDGAIVIRGKDGAATKPIITFSNNGNAFTLNANYQAVDNFEMQNTNGTKTASIAINIANYVVYTSVKRMKCSDSTNKFWKFLKCYDTKGVIDSNYVKNCAHNGMELGSEGNLVVTIANNVIKSCGNIGIEFTYTNKIMVTLENNIVAGCTGRGVDVGNTTSTGGGLTIRHNTFVSNGGDGLRISTSSNLYAVVVDSNISASNTGYGINWNVAAALMSSLRHLMRNNGLYSNSSGGTNNGASVSEVTTDPTFTNVGSDDYSIGTNYKSLGYPIGGTLYLGVHSATYNYVDPGAAQRKEFSARARSMLGF